jgi:surface carbohydrate biosynthesis protein
MAGKVNVFFEIETINRELDFRLYLASLCVDPHTRYYIGHHDTMFNLVGENNNGLYLGKNIRPDGPLPAQKLEGNYGKLKTRGHKLIWLDEEGGVFWGERHEWEQMMLRSLDPVALDAKDKVCVWGDLQREFYQGLHPSCSANIQTTGHPRFDLYKPKYREYYAAEVKRLRERYGDFLLVNTNFHRANTIDGLKKIFSRRSQSFTSQDRYYLLDRWLHINNVLTDFVRMITTVSVEMPELNIVIRPHPSENVDFYHMLFSSADNVHVTSEGSVGPWLFASRAMMHDGCTTAIEGHLCDTQVINYKTVIDERFDIPLPNLFGVRCHNPQQAVEMMSRVLKGETLAEDEELARAKQQQINATAPNLIANFPREREAFGCLTEKILAVVDTLPPESAVSYAPAGQAAPALNFLRGVKGTIRKQKKKRGLEQGMQPKFYGLDNADVPRRMSAIVKMLNKDVRYTVLSSELMCIEMN